MHETIAERIERARREGRPLRVFVGGEGVVGRVALVSDGWLILVADGASKGTAVLTSAIVGARVLRK